MSDAIHLKSLFPVGAGLLANAVDELTFPCLDTRIREQARSHKR